MGRDLTVEMNVRRGLTGTLMLLSVLDRSTGSVNVGANLGISGLFNPSTEYHYVSQSYPYYLDEYQYRQLDQNFLEDQEMEDQDVTILQDFNDLDEIDRQVTGPGILDDGGQIFGDLTPLLFTSPLVVGLSAMFNNVVTLNSTASNTSVPFGLWAFPELPVFPNLTLPGRKRRSLDNLLDIEEDLGQGYQAELGQVLGDVTEEEIAEKFKTAVKTLALLENTQCQAALGCRFGRMFRGREDRWNVITNILPLLRPLKWTVFTEMLERVSRSQEALDPIDCTEFYCEECLKLNW